MPQEVRVLQEGTLRWVQSSGTAISWQTASAPQSGLLGFVQAGLTFPDVTREYAQIYDRGAPTMHKLVRTNFVEATFTVLEGITADYPSPIIATASGTTVRGLNLEFRQAGPEGSAIYYQLIKGVITEQRLTEQDEGNTLAFTVRALTAVGPTASGYLA